MRAGKHCATEHLPKLADIMWISEKVSLCLSWKREALIVYPGAELCDLLVTSMILLIYSAVKGNVQINVSYYLQILQTLN